MVEKTPPFATYGLFGLIGMDWLALLLVVVSDIVIGMIVVESMLWKIKKGSNFPGGVTMTKIIDLSVKEKSTKEQKGANFNIK